MSFKPTKQLNVTRTLSTGAPILMGTLVQNNNDVFFQYDAHYLTQYGNSSPFNLKNNTDLQIAPKKPHDNLHGIFSDSLPDGWGRLLQDRIFRQHGIQSHEITAMDRLAFVGNKGMGGLSYLPISDYQADEHFEVDLINLGLEAQAVFDGQTETVLSELAIVGSSGGARPKALLYFNQDDFNKCKTYEEEGDESWLIKFTSKNLPLGHDEGLCEAIYLTLAKELELNPPQWRLIDVPKNSNGKSWLALKCFDRITNSSGKSGRLIMHSACGLLDADFRLPSLDYEDLIKVNRVLCKSVSAGKLQFKRAIFNLFASNQDDHSKNWSFLQYDDGHWEPAPFYDVTYNPNPRNEHITSFAGYGKKPPLNTIKQLAEIAGFESWQQAQAYIHHTVDVIARFSSLAKEYDVSKLIRADIEKTLADRLKENRHLL